MKANLRHSKPHGNGTTKRATSSALEVKRDLTIGDVARLSGVPATAIRFYETAGVLAPPPRRHGWRAYPASAVQTLRLIKLARLQGVGVRQLSVLRPLFDAGDPAAVQELVTAQIKHVDDLICALTKRQAMLSRAAACGCARLSECEFVANSD